ncbi:sulfotransferase [Actinocatenispora thailandica]|uniref:Sulfotransferase n=1 Tax=Actinocatenispora thailandica TaxID=227318 RepID=A0A7R7DVM7_9ACTN|nr:sulfotransferase [Actinocatenispora thailandica]BCJ38698.1 sulfotransferase [Actinocatenispora thailandica]
MSDRPAVVYLTGWCRSGTTLIGNLIGELPGALHVGELRYLWRHGVLGDGTNDTCGCGTRIADCPLWSAVLRRLGAPDGVPDLLERQQRLLRTRHVGARLAAIPATIAARRDLERLYGAIAAEAGARIIVDSGKFPAEAATVCGSDRVRPYVLHVLRDPRAVAESWRRPKAYIPAMSACRSTAYWVAFQQASARVGRAFPGRYQRLRYEDFAAAPADTLGAVLAGWGLAAAAPVTADGTAVLSPNHTVTGNPDRLRTGPVTIRPDERWRTTSPRTTRYAAGLLAAPWLHRYGYRLTGGADRGAGVRSDAGTS